jgi:hypothetical protein
MPITISRMVLACMFTAGVAVAATLGFVSGASAQWTPHEPPTVTTPTFTGDDIGFQSIGTDPATGVLMVRVNGKWTQAKVRSDGGLRPITR